MARQRSAAADHGAEHELEDGLFAEGFGDNLQAPAFLDEEALQQVRCAGRPAVRNWQPQVGDAGLEVVLEAGGRAREIGLVIGHHAARQVAGDGPGWSLIGGSDAGLEVRPDILGTLAARTGSRLCPGRVRSAIPSMTA